MSYHFDQHEASASLREFTRARTPYTKWPLSRISVSLPEPLVTAVDRLVVRLGFPSRSHAISLVLSRLIAEHRDNPGDEISRGTITILHGSCYDVHRELAAVRDRRSAQIISSLSSQVSGQTLEAMLVQGAIDKLRALVDELGSLRGVVFAQMQLIDLGSELSSGETPLGASKCEFRSVPGAIS